MTSSRRDFLGSMATNAALFGAMPLSLDLTRSILSGTPTTPGQGQQQWDLTWVKKLTGKHKAVFDVPEVESGYGVWRASIWAKQYQEVLGAAPKDISTVLVLRHNGITLAMQQAFWDKYGIGKAKNVTHPITLEPTDRNPALLASSRNEVPAELDDVALDKYLARGGVALACDLALQDCIQLIKSKDGVSDADARKQALAYMVPGVILQPSGVFAVIRAQEAGATYIRAS